MQKVEAGTAAEEDLQAKYQRRHDERREARERWSRLEQHVADVRLVVFSRGADAGLFRLPDALARRLWLIVPLVAFVALVVVHEPLRRRSGRAGRAMDFYAKGLARMDDRWAGTGVDRTGFSRFEPSLCRRSRSLRIGLTVRAICTARTRAGEEALASWLLAPASPETLIHERHEAIIELRPRLDLREDLELLGSDVRSGIDPDGPGRMG